MIHVGSVMTRIGHDADDWVYVALEMPRHGPNCLSPDPRVGHGRREEAHERSERE